MGSRLVIILDDLLWVLTDSQLKAALHFIDSLGGLIEKATILERKTKAARKLEVNLNVINFNYDSFKPIYFFLFSFYNPLYFSGIAGIPSASFSANKIEKCESYTNFENIH